MSTTTDNNEHRSACEAPLAAKTDTLLHYHSKEERRCHPFSLMFPPSFKAEQNLYVRIKLVRILDFRYWRMEIIVWGTATTPVLVTRSLPTTPTTPTIHYSILTGVRRRKEEGEEEKNEA